MPSFSNGAEEMEYWRGSSSVNSGIASTAVIDTERYRSSTSRTVRRFATTSSWYRSGSASAAISAFSGGQSQCSARVRSADDPAGALRLRWEVKISPTASGKPCGRKVFSPPTTTRVSGAVRRSRSARSTCRAELRGTTSR